MNEQELRGLLREAIARQAGISAEHLSQPSREAVMPLHPSHRIFGLPAGVETDGRCLIEPAVICDHRGYCKSYGH